MNGQCSIGAFACARLAQVVAAPYLLLAELVSELCLAAGPGVQTWPSGSAPALSEARPADAPSLPTHPFTRSDRRAMVHALVRSGTDEAHALLVHWLDDPDPKARLVAMHALVRAGNVEALERITTWLASGSPELLAAALQIVRAAPHLSPRLIEQLANLFTHQQGALRLAAWHALEERGIRLPARRALVLLQDELAELRMAGIRILARSGNRNVTVLVLERLADPDERVRSAAAHALASLGDVRAVPSLVRALALEGSSARSACLTALGALGGTQAVAALTAHIQTRDGDQVTRAALLSLGEIVARDGPEAEMALAALLERLQRFSGADPAQREVDLALAHAGPRAVRALARRLRRTPDWGVGGEAVDNDARIIEILEHSLTPQRAWAASKPGSAEAEAWTEAVESMTELLSTTSSAIPKAIAVLGRLGATHSVPDLAALAATDPSPGLRQLALQALLAIGSPEATGPAVSANLAHPFPTVRAAALSLWGATADTADAATAANAHVFEAALGDPHNEVVCAALSASARLATRAPKMAGSLLAGLTARLTNLLDRGLTACMRAALPALVSTRGAPLLLKMAFDPAGNQATRRLALFALASLLARKAATSPAALAHFELASADVDWLIQELTGIAVKEAAVVLGHHHLEKSLSRAQAERLSRLYPGLPPDAQFHLAPLVCENPSLRTVAQRLTNDDRTAWRVRKELLLLLRTHGVNIDIQDTFLPGQID